jgi:hypothetical protein
MVKKTITFTDFDGNEITKDFYFNLTKTEITKLEASGLSKNLERIAAEKNVPDFVDIWEEIILKAYGERTVDGKFIKSEVATNAFSQTEAYDILFEELVSDPEKGEAFIKGIMPKQK